MKKAVGLLVLMIFILSISSSVNAQTVKVFTEDFSPYNYVNEDGEITGVSTEIIREVFKEAGIETEIKVLPWARAYNMALNNDDIFIYSMMRTMKRENLFKWVVEVAPTESYLFKLKSRKNIKVDKLSDVRQYKVGAVRGDAGTQYLKDNGITNLQLVSENGLNIDKLLHKRVDLIEMDKATLVYKIKSRRLDVNMIEPIYFNKEISGAQYLACNKNVSDATIQKIQNAFNIVKKNGKYDEIINKWMK